MTWLAGVVLVVDVVLVLLLSLIGVVTGQGDSFLWFTIGMGAILVGAVSCYLDLEGHCGAQGARVAEPGDIADERRGRLSDRLVS